MLMKTLYLYELSIYFVNFIEFRFFEERRNDYLVMYTHHIATLFLISFSYFGGYQRVGTYILFVFINYIVVYGWFRYSS